MEAEPTKTAVVAETKKPEGDETSSVSSGVQIDPKLEKAALKQFDKWLLPAAFVFLMLSSLDRSNVSKTFDSPNTQK